jgi:3-dehydroquinate synthase
MSENIVVIGFMCTGKDTVGKELSKLTGKVFFSTDEFITRTMNMTINEIFDRYGEKYFRSLERRALDRIKDLKNVVVSAGGGIVIDRHNRNVLKKMGRIVHLEADIGALKRRLKDSTTRPLIRDAGAIKKLFEERKGMYDFADLEVCTGRKAPAKTAADIIKALHIESTRKEIPVTETWINTSSKSYPVFICAGDKNLDAPLKKKAPLGTNSPAKAMVISNPLVFTLYGTRIASAFSSCGIETKCHIVPDGERFKDLKTAGMLYDRLLKDDFGRGDLLVSLGGGVICDITGFVASTYKRGMHLIHVPTTLLAQVDAAIGGKTGVNHPQGKNMIGTYHQPDMVFCDVSMLLTLPEKEFLNGIAEAIKHGVIRDRRLFEFLKNKRELIQDRHLSSLKKIVADSIAVKRPIIEKDEREERKLREVLNFGHTIGHAVESTTGYRRTSHGEAVAMGMVAELKILNSPPELEKRIRELLLGYGLPVSVPGPIMESLEKTILRDKKKYGASLRIPVISGIGKAEIKEVACRDFLSSMDRI